MSLAPEPLAYPLPALRELIGLELRMRIIGAAIASVGQAEPQVKARLWEALGASIGDFENPLVAPHPLHRQLDLLFLNDGQATAEVIGLWRILRKDLRDIVARFCLLDEETLEEILIEPFAVTATTEWSADELLHFVDRYLLPQADGYDRDELAVALADTLWRTRAVAETIAFAERLMQPDSDTDLE